ncbi:conserved hypothetical protein; putative exported protein [Herminiimonas arsenicoxydans]|uniref:Integral membrane protein n=1 Tax=Herminiimonas arsenicoxydans TaxID=204773 RepID=A4G1Y2_HERAR|nr:conserved hypothetical protein; putative exported protein [Herminiimonas arsenicoxydans]
MNKKIVISTIMAVSLLAGGSAFAQRDDHRNDRGHNAHGQRDGKGGNRGHDSRRDHRDNRNNHVGAHDNGKHNGRGAGPRHDFYKGTRIPYEYRNRQYVVNDWRRHHLHAPPRGYQWVQTGPDYVLIAVSSGIIMQIVLGN